MTEMPVRVKLGESRFLRLSGLLSQNFTASSARPGPAPAEAGDRRTPIRRTRPLPSRCICGSSIHLLSKGRDAHSTGAAAQVFSIRRGKNSLEQSESLVHDELSVLTRRAVA